MPIDDLWVADDKPSDLLSRGKGVLFHVIQVLNVGLIAIGFYAIIATSISAKQRIDNELVNPSSSITINDHKMLTFPQTVICSYEDLDFTWCGLLQANNGMGDVKFCYDAAGESTLQPLWSKCNETDYYTGFECANQIYYMAEVSTALDISCYSINGPLDKNGDKVAKFGDLDIPFKAFTTGSRNSIELEWSLPTHDNEGNTITKTSEIVAEMYMGFFNPEHTVTVDEAESMVIGMSPSVLTRFQVSKKAVVSHLEETTTFWLTDQSFVPRIEPAGKITYEIGIFFRSLSVETITKTVSYTWLQAVAEVGGISGLLLGWSGLSLILWAAGLLRWATTRKSTKVTATDTKPANDNVVNPV